jgi:hypothetical protein
MSRAAAVPEYCRWPVTGTYSFDANGDTSLGVFGAYRPLADGSYRFVEAVRPRMP